MKKRSKSRALAPFEVQKASAEGAFAGASVVVRGELSDNKRRKRHTNLWDFSLFFGHFLAIYLAFLLLLNAKIAGVISPFAVGLAFALILVREKPFFIAPIFLAAYITLNFSLEGLIISACVFCSMLAMYFLFLLIKKQTPLWCVPIFQILALAGYIYFNVGTKSELLQTITYIIISILFCYICYGFLRAAKGRGVLSGFTLDENICLALLLMAFSLGLYDVYIWKFNIATIIVCFGMLLTSQILGTKQALYFCAIAGLGLAFANNSLTSLAIFCSWAVAVAALGKVNRYASAIGVFVVDFILGAYFHGYALYTWVQAVTMLIPGLVFCVIPKKWLDAVTRKVEIASGVGGLMFLDLDRERIKKKIDQVSKTLENMGETYRRIGGSASANTEPKDQVAKDVVARLCRNCENYNRCMREKNMYQDIMALSRAGIEKNKASLIDITKNIAMNCSKTTSLLSSVNYAVENRAKTEKLLESEDHSRIAIGDQLVGTSKILGRVSSSLSTRMGASADTTKMLKEELLSENIVAKDIVVANGEETYITMLVGQKEKEDKIVNIVNAVFKVKFICKSKLSKFAGTKLLELRPAPKFDISVGVASEEKVKGLENGDVFSFVELEQDKVLVALCDGMGSGNMARSASEEVLTLVENFYRAGFESEFIMKSVSRLLACSGREVFSTLDVCVFDKHTGNVDFVKASSPPTAWKRGDQTALIESESLPIGIVESDKEQKYMRLLSSGDVVVLASDGVYDAFGSDEEFAHTINNINSINMNLLCENLLEEAKSRRGEGKDDMTVVAMRVI